VPPTPPLSSDPKDLVRALPLWRGPVEIECLTGGLTNRNYLVHDAIRRVVVRLGGDIPVHGILRFNEHAISRAAAAAGISPAVLHTGAGVIVFDFIDGRTCTSDDIRGDRDRCVALLRRVHREVALHLRGPILAFNVFHILRDYGHSLVEAASPAVPLLPHLQAAAARLEQSVGPIELVLGHNDLLPANFMDDGQRLWLVDWDYAGFNTPLFDLGGLSSNAGFTAAEDEALLEAYFGRPVDDGLRLRFRAMRCASLLRETLWGFVSERHATLDFDYAAYGALYLARFEAAWTEFEEWSRS
jgi:thiamine kinase-like enzyme